MFISYNISSSQIQMMAYQSLTIWNYLLTFKIEKFIRFNEIRFAVVYPNPGKLDSFMFPNDCMYFLPMSSI